MKNILRKLVLTLALAAPALVYAAPFGSFTDEGGSFGDTDTTKAGSFSDSFSFTLLPGTGFWDVSYIDGAGKGVKNLAISLYDNGKEVFPTSSIVKTVVPGLGTEYSYTDIFPKLSAGSFVLDVAGYFESKGSSYSGVFILVPAVPEPSTWFAMIVGMALMLTVAVRRKNSNV